MNVIEVIPIAKGLKTETLSYFSPENLPLGAVVSVPLRKKTVQAIVTRVDPVSHLKSQLKNAPFALKKISSLNNDDSEATPILNKTRKPRPFFLPEFIEMAQEASLYYATSTGSTLDALVPDIVLKRSSSFKNPPLLPSATKKTPTAKLSTSSTDSDTNFHEIRAIQGDDEDRYSSYRSLIRQIFTKKESVFIMLPTIEDAIRAYSLIDKGIEDYAFLLHNSLSPKKLIDTWNRAVLEKHPVVIVATGSFLCLPRADIGTIIIEKENGRGYKSLRRPYIDLRTVAEIYTKRKNIPLVIGDILLRAETLWRQSEGLIQESAPFKFRSLSTAKDSLIDMRQYKTAENPEDRFRILSLEVERLIRANKENNESMIILAARRGIAPSVICADCQTIVTCNNCSAPVILHKAPVSPSSRPTATPTPNPKSFFMCHRCGARRPSEEYCKVCSSWKLSTLGIGIDLVADTIRQKFPDITISQIDADTTKTQKQAHEAIAHVQDHPGSILLGTEMMLLYPNKKVHNAAIISLDSLFSIPDFRIQEKIIHTLLTLRSLTTKEFIVQTRRAEEKVFEYALKGNLSDFYRDTIAERNIFNYPPFVNLIKITLEGPKEAIIAEMNSIQKSLEPHVVDIFPAFTHTVRGEYVLHGLMRIPRGNWPSESLSNKLRSLPPSVSVNIDPESLL